MTDITQTRKALINRILEGDGKASRAQRLAAFDHTGFSEPLNTLIDKVVKQAYRVTDGDIAAAKASGLSEDQIFEIIVCAALGQAARQHDTALAAVCRIGFHMFRHTYRAWLDETGAPMGVQQKLMRHAHISTTMDQYGNASEVEKRKANRPIVQRVLGREGNEQFSIQ